MTHSEDPQTRLGFLRSSPKKQKSDIVRESDTRAGFLRPSGDSAHRADKLKARAGEQISPTSSDTPDISTNFYDPSQLQRLLSEAKRLPDSRPSATQTSDDQHHPCPGQKPKVVARVEPAGVDKPFLPAQPRVALEAAPPRHATAEMATRIGPLQPTPNALSGAARWCEATPSSPSLSLDEVSFEETTDKVLGLRGVTGAHLRLLAAAGILGVTLVWAFLDSRKPLPVSDPPSAQHLTASNSVQSSTAHPENHADSNSESHKATERNESLTSPVPQSAQRIPQPPSAETEIAANATTPAIAVDQLFAGKRMEAVESYLVLAKQRPNDEVYRVIVQLLQESRKAP